jgi:cell division protein FtsN
MANVALTLTLDIWSNQNGLGGRPQTMKYLIPAIGLAWLACAVPAGAQVKKNPAAEVKAGVDAWERADYAAAVKKWRPLAAAGDADAQFNLGQAYKLGWGVPMDLPVATEWFRKAAAQGHIRAEDNYGLLLFRAGKKAQAIPFIQKSAVRGEPRAQYILGTALFNGEHMEKDWVRAYAMMTRAVASGLPQATNSLALMDQYMPLEQRQEGTRLAAQLEQQERSNMLAATQMPPQPAPKPTTPAAPPARSGKPAPIKPADLPPSTVAAVVVAQPVPAVPAPATPAPVKPEPAKAPSLPDGDWRIQLGAFSDKGKAERLWTDLLTRVKGLNAYQPYLETDKAITRLQAGPLTSQAAALKLCEAVRAVKADCIVKPR